MALVAYDASDCESTTDEEAEDATGTVEIIENPATNNTNLFQQLPQPKAPANFVDLEEENDEFLLKKEVPTEKPTVRKPIRIVAPSLKDLDSDEDEPKEKKSKFTSKASGLLSILPPPKTSSATNKTFIPHALQKKAKAPVSKAKPIVPQKVVTKVPANSQGSVTDDEDDIHVEEFDVSTWKQVCGRKTKPTADPIIEVVDQSTKGISEITTAPEPEKPYEGLDNEAFKKLVGASRMPVGNIKLIDINEEEVLMGEDILRAKALTDPDIEAKIEPEPVSTMSKKKHHITYLAQQAKANEQELKNRWAANRYSRKQTQAKYGF